MTAVARLVHDECPGEGRPVRTDLDPECQSAEGLDDR
jgi:hypothetical protein